MCKEKVLNFYGDTMTETSGHVKGLNERPLILRLTTPQVTLSDIARAAGCSLTFVSLCAHGHRKPTRKVQQAAERLLGRSASELFPEWPSAR